jgi:hypothetical protein
VARICSRCYPIANRYLDDEIPKFLRRDAAFANPNIFEFLEEEEFFYAIRIPANDVLYNAIEYLLARTVGRPPRRPIVFYASFSYQQATGTSRVVWWRRSSGIGKCCFLESDSS